MEHQERKQQEAEATPVIPSSLRLVVSGALLLLVVAAGVWLYRSGPSSASLALDTLQAEQTLFVASVNRAEDEHVLHIVIFNPNTRQLIETRTVSVTDTLTDNSTAYSTGANNAVQFDPATRTVLYQTDGASGYDGTCINDDGTCGDRIYTVDLDTGSTTLLFAATDNIGNWLVVPEAGTVVMSLPVYNFSTDSYTQRIVLVRMRDGAVLADSCCELLDERTDLYEFALVGSFVYQVRYAFPGSVPVSLKTIDPRNGATSVRELYQSRGSVDAQTTGISPDGTLFALYDDGELVVRDLRARKTSNIPIEEERSSVGLLWAGARGILVGHGRWSIYSVDAKEEIATLPETAAAMHSAAPSGRYMLFSALGQTPAQLFDRDTDEIIPIPDLGPALLGFQWF